PLVVHNGVLRASCMFSSCWLRSGPSGHLVSISRVLLSRWDSLLMGAPLDRMHTSLPQIADDPTVVLPPLKVHRQLRALLPCTRPIRLLCPCAATLMKPGTTPDWDAVIDDFLIQGVPKAIAAGHEAIWPGHRTVRLHELPLPG